MAATGFTGSRSGVNFIEVDWAPLPSIVASSFNTLGANVKSMREPLHRAVKQVMTTSIRTNFEQGGRPQWEPLSSFTMNRKKRGGSLPLTRSGQLKRKASQINAWKITREDATMQDTTGYGLYHQEGWTTPDGVGAPARPWAMIQPEDANDIEEIFFDWIEERMAQAGLGGF